MVTKKKFNRRRIITATIIGTAVAGPVGGLAGFLLSKPSKRKKRRKR